MHECFESMGLILLIYSIPDPGYIEIARVYIQNDATWSGSANATPQSQSLRPMKMTFPSRTWSMQSRPGILRSKRFNSPQAPLNGIWMIFSNWHVLAGSTIFVVNLWSTRAPARSSSRIWASWCGGGSVQGAEANLLSGAWQRCSAFSILHKSAYGYRKVANENAWPFCVLGSIKPIHDSVSWCQLVYDFSIRFGSVRRAQRFDP